MPLMEVVLNQTYYNQECVNRWNYMASGSPASVTLSFGLLSALGGIPTSTVLPTGTLFKALQTLQNTGVQFISVIARAIYIDEDFFDNPFFAGTAGAGGAAAGNLSPTDAWGFRSTRVRQSIGRGYKRFVGVDDEMISSGGTIVGAAVGQAVAVASAMGEVLTYDDSGTTLTFTPCVVQKEKYHPVGKTTWAYRYYADESVQDDHIAEGIAWAYYPQTRTQTSRQYGRGM